PPRSLPPSLHDALPICDGGGIAFDAKNEVGIGQQTFERPLNPEVEAAGASSGVIEIEQRAHVFVGDRTPVGPVSECGEDLLRAGDRKSTRLNSSHQIIS